MSVTSEYLVKGYALALEQCGLLLRGAVRLYEDGSYATAVVLAAFAREELGRSKILLDLWRNQRGGQSVTVEQIDAACGEHVDKQRAGMLSMTMRADRQTGLGKILTDSMTNTPQSQKWKDADAALKQIDEKKAKRTPDDRHSTRMRSLYVEPSSSGWNRPADMAAQTAHDFLQDAVNDYSLRYSQGYIAPVQSILKDIDADLYSALEQLADRPQLPPPEQPSWPGSDRDTVQSPRESAFLAARDGSLILKPSDLQPGDVLLYRPHCPNFIQKKISSSTGSPYTHAAIYIGNGLIAESVPLHPSRSALRNQNNAR